MRHLDLFSGIGGFALAASWVWGDEHEPHAFVEIDEFCQKVLGKHWPDVPIHNDIREYRHDGTIIDILTGGFPCQPFSCAGQQRSEKDDRFLWPEMFRVIKEAHPTWIIGENVAGIINLALDRVCSELEQLGYEVRPFDIPACSIGAKHCRRRIWIVAHLNRDGFSNESGSIQGQNITPGNIFAFGGRSIEVQRLGDGFQPHPLEFGWKTHSGICRDFHGVSPGVDKHRIHALGNAIVPQVVVPIMEAIKAHEGVVSKATNSTEQI